MCFVVVCITTVRCTQLEPQTATGTCGNKVLTLKFDSYLILPGTERSGWGWGSAEQIKLRKCEGLRWTRNTFILLHFSDAGKSLTVQSLGLFLAKGL